MEKNLEASISSMGYGYEVKILVNGIDIGAKGGQSESMRLFSADHSMRKEATPEMQERLFVLKTGENKLQVEAEKNGAETDQLTVELYVGDGMEAVLTLKSTDAKATYDQGFTLSASR